MTITIKRPTFLSSDYSVSVNGNTSHTAKVKFRLKDPKEIRLQPTSGRAGDSITMRPVTGTTGYGEKEEYSVHKGDRAEPVGYFWVEGRVSPTIRFLDAKHSELGLVEEKSKLYSLMRTWLRKVLPNYYTCKNNGTVIFSATEVYTPFFCRVKIQRHSDAPATIDDFAICAGLWIACTPSF